MPEQRNDMIYDNILNVLFSLVGIEPAHGSASALRLDFGTGNFLVFGIFHYVSWSSVLKLYEENYSCSAIIKTKDSIIVGSK